MLTFAGFGCDNSIKLYGIRNEKCLRISNKDLKSISGYFENDELIVSNLCFYKRSRYKSDIVNTYSFILKM